MRVERTGEVEENKTRGEREERGELELEGRKK